MSHALTLITFIPLFATFVVLALPDTMKSIFKWIAVAATIPQLAIALYLYEHFDTTTTAVQFAEKAQWIPSYHISYFVGVGRHQHLDGDPDGDHHVFLGVRELRNQPRGEGLLRDAAAARHRYDGRVRVAGFFLFYIFWEVMLLPMYFLIGIWGGPRREYAAIKFFLYTLLGSVLILLAMLGLYYYGATPTFDLTVLAANSSQYSMSFQRIAWIALFIGFAIKIPAFPFHTWLPDAHVEAPTAISVILAGVLLKMGTYGILRVNFAVLPGATMQLAWLFLA